jgi:membrane protease YdiL (CAAX protease family)
MKKNALLIFFIVFYIVWIIRATWFYSMVDASIANEVLKQFFSIFVKFALWVLPAAAFVYWLDGENPLEKMKVNTPVNQNNLVLVLVVSTIYFTFVFLLEYILSGRTLLPLVQAPLLNILIALIGASPSAVIEELFFRGFVLSKMELRFSFWKANVIQAFLFTAIHWPNWLWVKGFHIQEVVTSLGVFILALLLGWVLKKSNSVWPPVVIHIVNNLLAVFLG